MNKPRILAIDQATASGWACGRADEKARHGTIRMPKRDVLGERLLALFHSLRELIRGTEPDLIVYETPFMPRPSDRASGWPTIALTQKIEGIVLLCAAEASIPVESYPSQTWRLGFLGYGRAPKGADKGHMKKACLARVRMLGYAPANNDEGDSLGLWFYATTGKPASERAQGDLLAAASARL